MVKIKLLLPRAAEISRLGRLHAPLQVCEQTGAVLRPSTLFLSSPDQRSCVRLSVEYADVMFKFEIFNLRPTSSPQPVASELREVAVFSDWDEIGCVVACEWIRPAHPGEVPAGWEPIIGERGPRSAIPDSVLAVGVSVVGLVFRSTSLRRASGMLYSADDDRAALSISRSGGEIDSFAADCEVIALSDFSSWQRSLAKWHNSLTGVGAASA